MKSASNINSRIEEIYERYSYPGNIRYHLTRPRNYHSDSRHLHEEEGRSPDLFVNAVEMKNCKDNAGFARELFPATLIFALVCIAFGIEEFLNIFFSFPKIETAIALGIFLLSWGYFSAVLRKKRDKYCGKF